MALTNHKFCWPRPRRHAKARDWTSTQDRSQPKEGV